MAYSYVSYTGNGVTTTYSVTFPYILKSHVIVSVDGVDKTSGVDYTWATGASIQFGVAPTNGAVIRIRRETSRGAALVDFQDASTLTEADLDKAFTQSLYISQEAFDATTADAEYWATQAANSAAAAASSYDSFDDRYLGPKAVAPTVDNDGNALVTGAIYFNTAGNAAYVWNGSSWQLTATSLSTSNPAMNGVADPGVAVTASKSDHVHPTDTSLIAKSIVDAKGDLIGATADNTPARVAVGADGKVLMADSSASAGVSWQPLQGRNLLHNPQFVIDQRGNSAGITASTTFQYAVDRWASVKSGTNTYSHGRGGSTSSQFRYNLYTTCTAGGTVSAGDYNVILQRMEGYTTAHARFGTSFAKSLTLSFWVYSTKTGTLGGSLRNGASNRSYPFTVTISAANTWEYKTVVIPGDTSGTWADDNSNSMTITFGFACGTTYQAAAGAWATGNYFGATGQTQWATTNDSINIANVQLEVSPVATDFEVRPVQLEIDLCRRYYWRNGGYNTYQWFAKGYNYNTTTFRCSVDFPVEMRIVPTPGVSGAGGFVIQNGGSTFSSTAVNPVTASTTTVGMLDVSASGLTAGAPGDLLANNSLSSWIDWDAQL